MASADWHNYNAATGEERHVIPHLNRLGIDAEFPFWDLPSENWKRFDAVIIRSTWDYPHKLTQFKNWIEQLEAQHTPVFNSGDVIRWNIEKTYLKQIEEWGFDIVPTVWVQYESPAFLSELIEKANWQKVIVKPTISVGAENTLLIDHTAMPTEFPYQSNSSLMIQPFLSEITSEGEWSFVFLGGTFSHCVRKVPKAGDFRIHQHHGGTYYAETPPTDGLELAKGIVKKITSPLLYARVDMVRSEGKFMLLELELIEPSLYLEFSKTAPELLARSIAASIH